ncbi:hypothetical protein GLYMA_02G246200v4 [Glycine max]|uniref:Uncharacterized protein n=1 Tax=Glycine max TaxID=3847 RepID=A0A0R0L8M0_SOYBN|nr:hypothetical protein GYH30_005099 [Glycine max]KRH73013.1 hypothetical protein GLYMA_02G246200v4 [Glycine max]
MFPRPPFRIPFYDKYHFSIFPHFYFPPLMTHSTLPFSFWMSTRTHIEAEHYVSPPLITGEQKQEMLQICY